MFNASAKDQAICPLIKKPCLKEGCGFYLEISGVDKDNKPTIEKECVYIWGLKFQIENIQTIEAHRRTTDTSRTEHQKRFELFMDALSQVCSWVGFNFPRLGTHHEAHSDYPSLQRSESRPDDG